MSISVASWICNHVREGKDPGAIKQELEKIGEKNPEIRKIILPAVAFTIAATHPSALPPELAKQVVTHATSMDEQIELIYLISAGHWDDFRSSIGKEVARITGNKDVATRSMPWGLLRIPMPEF